MAEISWRAGQQIGQRHEAPVRVVRKSIGEHHGEVLRPRAVNGTVVPCGTSKSTAFSVHQFPAISEEFLDWKIGQLSKIGCFHRFWNWLKWDIKPTNDGRTGIIKDGQRQAIHQAVKVPTSSASTGSTSAASWAFIVLISTALCLRVCALFFDWDFPKPHFWIIPSSYY